MSKKIEIKSKNPIVVNNRDICEPDESNATSTSSQNKHPPLIPTNSQSLCSESKSHKHSFVQKLFKLKTMAIVHPLAANCIEEENENEEETSVHLDTSDVTNKDSVMNVSRTNTTTPSRQRIPLIRRISEFTLTKRELDRASQKIDEGPVMSRYQQLQGKDSLNAKQNTNLAVNVADHNILWPRLLSEPLVSLPEGEKSDADHHDEVHDIKLSEQSVKKTKKKRTQKAFMVCSPISNLSGLDHFVEEPQEQAHQSKIRLFNTPTATCDYYSDDDEALFKDVKIPILA